MADEILGYSDAATLAEKRLSPRARRLANLERWVEGRQYEHLCDWFEDRPLAEKAPCIVDPIVEDAIESHVDMVLGEGRFPVVTSRPAEDDKILGEEDMLAENDSAILDRFVVEVMKQVRFRALCREALGASMGVSSACAIYGVREGKLCGETVKAWWCVPEFDAERKVSRLVIEYPYVETAQEQDGTWKAKARIFRREIDAQNDVTMAPGDAEAAKIDWRPASTIAHGFGFCPVVWYPHLRRASIVADYDGRALHERLLDEIRAHDMAVTQRHRAALYAGDPQWTETGVELGYNPTAPGRIVGMPSTARGGPAASDNPITGHYTSGGQQTGRKKHPGVVAQYESADTKVTLHTLPGDALDAIKDNANDIRSKLLEALAFVPLDSAGIQGLRVVSGAMLDKLRRRQTDHDDKVRDDFGDNFILPSIDMLLRIGAKVGDGARVRGLAKVLPILAKFNDEAA